MLAFNLLRFERFVNVGKLIPPRDNDTSARVERKIISRGTMYDICSRYAVGITSDGSPPSGT